MRIIRKTWTCSRVLFLRPLHSLTSALLCYMIKERDTGDLTSMTLNDFFFSLRPINVFANQAELKMRFLSGSIDCSKWDAFFSPCYYYLSCCLLAAWGHSSSSAGPYQSPPGGAGDLFTINTRIKNKSHLCPLLFLLLPLKQSTPWGSWGSRLLCSLVHYPAPCRAVQIKTKWNHMHLHGALKSETRRNE